MISRSTLILASAAALLQIGLLWGTELPLGVPEEWTWSRIPYSEQHLFGWLMAGIAGLVFLLMAWLGGRRITRCPRWERGFWVVALVASSLLWLMNVIGINPEPAGMGRVPFVLYYPRSSGYFWQARYQVTDLQEFLKTYEASIQDSTNPDNHLHLGTHPPGLTVSFYAMRQLCLRFPALQNLILATEPTTVGEAFAEIERNVRRSGRPWDETDRACLWLAAMMVLGSIALTTAVLYALVIRTTNNPFLGWTVACLWPLIPSLSIFFPKSDVLFPLFAVVAQWFWLVALERRSFWAGVASAWTLIAGMLLSLGLLPVAAMFGLQSLLHAWGTRSNPLIPIAGAFAGVAAAVLGISLAGGMNLLGIWLQNIHNHAAFYDHNTRTWLTWLWVNPVELAGALGGPVVVFLGLSLRNQMGQFNPFHPGWSVPLVWGLLWLSGKNMGEAARLWNFLMPLLLWSGVSLGSSWKGQPEAGEPDRNLTRLLILVLLQMLVCVATISRIDGFHLAEM